jgi:hypothetical protein
MLLLYCMTESGIERKELLGVNGSEVRAVEHNGVACHFSDSTESHPSSTQTDALAFWSVVDRLFQQNSVIPFRYPTLMEDEPAIRDFLATNADVYLNELQRVRGLVQAKITISEAVSTPTPNTASPASGTEYLKQRQRISQSITDAVEAAKNTGSDLVKDWKQLQRKDATILFALIERNALTELKSRILKLDNVAAQVRVSGPWPPTEFVNCDPELPSLSKTKNG